MSVSTAFVTCDKVTNRAYRHSKKAQKLQMTFVKEVSSDSQEYLPLPLSLPPSPSEPRMDKNM